MRQTQDTTLPALRMQEGPCAGLQLWQAEGPMQTLLGVSGGQAAFTMLAKAQGDCFRLVASTLFKEQMFAIICCGHKNEDTNCLSRPALPTQSHYCSRPRSLFLQGEAPQPPGEATCPSRPSVLPGLRCKPWELILFLVAAHPRRAADFALCL